MGMRLAIIIISLVVAPVHVLARPGLTFMTPCPGEAGGALLAPRTGSAKVPTNARLWIHGSGPGRYALVANGREAASFELDEETGSGDSLALFEPAPLAPRTQYTVRLGANAITEFTTGGAVDRTPPAAPRIKRVFADGSQDAQFLSFDATSSKDTVFLQITTAGNKEGVLAPATGAQLSSACGLSTVEIGQRICVEVRALDVAGNRSRPTRACARVQGIER